MSPPTTPPPSTLIDHALIEASVSAAVKMALSGLNLNTPFTSRKKRTTTSNNDSSAPDYIDFGRYYLRQADPFLPIDRITTFGLQHEIQDSDDETSQELSSLDARYLLCWNTLCQVIPGFKNTVLELSNKLKEQKCICKQISSGSAKAHSDNTSSLRDNILSMLSLSSEDQNTLPPSLQKLLHGWNHLVIARALCPVKYDPTEETLNKIREGQLSVTAALLPRLLFPDDHVHDPTDISKDVLHGSLLPRVCRHIYLGPSTALNPGTSRGHSGNAAIAGLTKMAPKMIAYAAIQARYTLSSATTWNPIDGVFKYPDFYCYIIGLFDDPDDRISHLEVFGSTSGMALLPTPAPPEDENDNFELAKQQRAAKRARLSEQELDKENNSTSAS
ncbi:hypothetical protein H0H92_000934 [Tricholoma furcatifolium]|nr:hypothetical protein H0H92_000934 [Tricholoma furcatifolium]